MMRLWLRSQVCISPSKAGCGSRAAPTHGQLKQVTPRWSRRRSWKGGVGPSDHSCEIVWKIYRPIFTHFVWKFWSLWLKHIPSSLGDLPCLMSTGDESSSYSSRRQEPGSCFSSASKKTISPRKRSRTSRVQHIQRPCLDFEKMQQVRWRWSWSRWGLTLWLMNKDKKLIEI